MRRTFFLKPVLGLLFLVALAGCTPSEDIALRVDGLPVPIAFIESRMQEHRAAVFALYRERYGARYGPDFWTRRHGASETPLRAVQRRAVADAIRMAAARAEAGRLGLSKEEPASGLPVGPQIWKWNALENHRHEMLLLQLKERIAAPDEATFSRRLARVTAAARVEINRQAIRRLGMTDPLPPGERPAVPVRTASAGRTFYLDAVYGDDSRSGADPSSAWRTLARLNETTLRPGDRVLLRGGGIFTGPLQPRGSGAEGAPIVLDRYGEGPDPVIDGAGRTGGGAIHLHNQSYWEIGNLEITNPAPKEGDRRGVYISAANAGTIRHIYLRNLHVHHVRGIVGQSIEAKLTGGIALVVVIEDDRLAPTLFDDVRIEGCRIRSVDNTGLFTDNLIERDDYPRTPAWDSRRFTNILIRNNVIHDIGKNAMILRLLDGGLVEHNLCYDTAYRAGTGNTIFARSADGTVFQFNEGYLNRATGGFDGSLYDADLQSPNTVWQYSYSHDNAHGLMWIITVPRDSNIVVRYNISRNDRGQLLAVHSAVRSAAIHNNVFYIPEHLSPVIIHEKPGVAARYHYASNIVYNLSPTASYHWGDAERTFERNVFFGLHPANEPADPAKITADPLLTDPGSGGLGLATLGGYRLRPGSPCIDRGAPLSGPRDFYGNPVPYGSGPDCGVHEWRPEAPPQPR